MICPIASSYSRALLHTVTPSPPTTVLGVNYNCAFRDYEPIQILSILTRPQKMIDRLFDFLLNVP